MNKARLLKLAKHLEKGKLYHKIFNIMYLDVILSNVTCGCAIGETPLVFPKLISFDDFNIYKENPTIEYAIKLFNIYYREACFLFNYNSPIFNYITNGVLNPEVTKEEVAKHIRKFVKNNGIYEYKPE